MSKDPTELVDYFEDYQGDIYTMHPPEVCTPQPGGDEFPCVIHRPTAHRMRNWPLTLDTRSETHKNWLDAHGLPHFVPLMLRVCPCADAEHLVPDFDAVMHWERTIGAMFPQHFIPSDCSSVKHSEPTDDEMVAWNEHVTWMDVHWPGWDGRIAVPVGRASTPTR